MALSKQYRTAEDVCRSKHRYGSMATAEKVAAAATRRHGRTISAYKCGHCEWWHLTSQPAR